jgi:hypothetical protein
MLRDVLMEKLQRRQTHGAQSFPLHRERVLDALLR